MGIIHQDIKPENILVSDDFDKVILIDFGISNVYSHGMVRFYSPICTLPYRPPEILLECVSYNSKVDMWSLGCVIAEMLCGHQMFCATQNNGDDQIRLIFRKLSLPNEETWPGVTNARKWNSKDFVAGSFPKKRFLNLYIDDIRLKTMVDGLLTLNPENRFSATQALNEQ